MDTPLDPEERARSPREHPIIHHDNAFFWEGTKDGRLLYRACARCGRIHHPSGPMCPQCNSVEWDVRQSSGKGEIYSFAIGYYPQFPGLEYPNPVVLVELEENWRLVANLVGTDIEEIAIGLPVQVEFKYIDDELTVPQFRVIGPAKGQQ